jgi:hypothetical protein
MKFTWKGRWKGGEIVIAAETIEELNADIEKLFASNREPSPTPTSNKAYPLLPAGLGCSEAVLTLLGSEWGAQQRSMADIRKALEANGLFFSKGTLSGTLTFLTKRGDIARTKSAGSWVYMIKESMLNR